MAARIHEEHRGSIAWLARQDTSPAQAIHRGTGLPGHHVQGTMLPWKVTRLQESLRDMRVLDDEEVRELHRLGA